MALTLAADAAVRARVPVSRALLTAVVIGLLAFAGFGSLPSADSSAQDAAAFEEIDAYLEELAEEERIPGLAVRILDGEETVHEHLTGVDGEGEPVTASTPFLVGSLAKTVTATLILQLVESGDLSLDDRAADYVPAVGDADPTLRELLTHTSGYSTLDGLRVADQHDRDEGPLRDAVDDLEKTGEPGTYAYSAANYLVLGAVIEDVTGEPYGSYAESRLMDPLGMDDSAATAEGASDVAAGHRYWWGLPRSYDPGFDPSGASYGQLVSTLEDLTTFVRAQGSDDLLDRELREQAQSQHVETSNGGYGFGWRTTTHEGADVVHHTGANPGYFAHIFRVPEKDLDVVLLVNAHSEAKAPIVAGAAPALVTLYEGGDPEPTDADPMLTALPWVLTGIAGASAISLVLAIRHPRRRPWRLVAAGIAAVALGAGFFPTLIGYDHQLLQVWFPDAAAARVAVIVLAGLTVVLLLLPARARRRGAGRKGTDRSSSRRRRTA